MASIPAASRHPAFAATLRPVSISALHSLSLLGTLALAFTFSACGGSSSPQGTPQTQAEAKAPPKPQPKPLPVAEPEPAPAPVKALPKTLGTLEEVTAAATEIYSQHRRTFYCNCAYTPQERVARGTCGYKTRADESLSKRVAWDHVVPNRAFGQHRQCWREPICKDEAGNAFSGVRCCRQVDEEFQTMERDLHNIVPAVGELQADRSDFDFGELEGETRMYGACDFEVDRSQQRAEPSERSRGDIARAYLYMHEVYGEGLPLTPEETARFEAWHEADPASAWEVQRNKRIAALQGVGNSYVPMIAMAGGDDEDFEEPEEAPEEAPAAPAADKTPAPAEPKPEAPSAESPAKEEAPAKEAAPADEAAPAKEKAPAEPTPAEPSAQ